MDDRRPVGRMSIDKEEKTIAHSTSDWTQLLEYQKVVRQMVGGIVNNPKALKTIYIYLLADKL